MYSMQAIVFTLTEMGTLQLNDKTFYYYLTITGETKWQKKERKREEEKNASERTTWREKGKYTRRGMTNNIIWQSIK